MQSWLDVNSMQTN